MSIKYIFAFFGVKFQVRQRAHSMHDFTFKTPQQIKFKTNIKNYSQNGQNWIVLSQKRKKHKTGSTFKNIKLSIIEHCVGQWDETCTPVFRFFLNIKFTMRQQKFGLFLVVTE